MAGNKGGRPEDSAIYAHFVKKEPRECKKIGYEERLAIFRHVPTPGFRRPRRMANDLGGFATYTMYTTTATPPSSCLSLTKLYDVMMILVLGPEPREKNWPRVVGLIFWGPLALLIRLVLYQEAAELCGCSDLRVARTDLKIDSPPKICAQLHNALPIMEFYGKK
ncbi:hypothetical protein BDQ17DRAFT_1333346 [Cyathus striatus]|nr:hypothetical protein BDQ17DRAFT_1333346 [Cyathus striatus]